MRIIGIIACLAVYWTRAAQAQGRALPIEANNHLLDQLQIINPEMVYDDTYLLTDLAGTYSFCEQSQRGFQSVIGRVAEEGHDLEVYIDSVSGSEGHVRAVTGYLRGLIENWIFNQQFNDKVRDFVAYGCGVHPSCPGDFMSVACVFKKRNPEDN